MNWMFYSEYTVQEQIFRKIRSEVNEVTHERYCYCEAEKFKIFTVLAKERSVCQREHKHV